MAVLQRRIGLLFAGAILLLLGAVARTFYLGVVRGASLRQVADSEQVSNEVIPAQRGTISDRGGAALAISLPTYEIIADPYLVKNAFQTARALAPLLAQKAEALSEALQRPTGYVILAKQVPAAAKTKALALGLSGIEAVQEMTRTHPRGELAGQLLGVLGAEAKPESGLELSAEALLAGEPGQRRVVRDGKNQAIAVKTVRSERPGADLTLTIDANIQQRSEEVLAADAAVFHPHNLTAIVVEPQSGSILAMADWPPLNPDQQSSWNAETLSNSAVSLNYEPGSTFKTVAIAGALQQGLITPQSSFEVPEALELGERVIHDAESHPTEVLTASQILARSSNVGVIKIASLEGAQSFNSWAHAFGFGAPSGAGLQGEESGLLPPPSSYSGSSMGNLPFGQGEMVTPLQLLNAYAAIADGGVLRAPHLIAAIDGRPQPLPPGHRIISEGTAEELRQMLKGPLQPGGTAAEVSIPGYVLAGKTGTAEKIDPATHEYSKSRYIASFIGFAPVVHPRLLGLVVANEPQAGSIYGGKVAAPAWAQILSFALPYSGVAAG